MFTKCYFLLSILVVAGAQDGPIIETIYGAIQGSWNTLNGSVYEEYLGVPYAAPPVRERRWQIPEAPVPWDGVLNATEHGQHCVQFIFLNRSSGEDCLFLNIYVPGTNRNGDDLAVMVYFSGGGFTMGTGKWYPAYDLALTGDVIVITANYRVGPIGFLSTEDDAALGNYGLWDARAVLLWVQENIAAFGGDADRVTVFGQSAGAALTSHLLISPEMKGLVQRGIMMSGQSTGPFGVGLKGNVKDSTELLGTVVGCRRMNDSYELVECLRGVPAETLDLWAIIVVIGMKHQLPNFIPVIDGYFVPQRPEYSWEQGASYGMGLLTGRLEHDGHMFVTFNIFGMPIDPINFADNKTLLDDWLHFQFAHYPDTEAGVEAAYDRYPLLMDNSSDTRTREATRQTTDFWFSTFSHAEAFEHARHGGNAYLYNFQYRPSFAKYPHEWVNGSHCDDLYFLFGYDLLERFRRIVLRDDFTEPDYYVSYLEMTYFTNFAKSGNPNEGGDVPITWQAYEEDTKTYLEISDDPSILYETEEMLDTYRFWREDFPDIVGITDNTSPVTTETALTEEDVMDAIENTRDFLYNAFPEEDGIEIDLALDEGNL